MAFNLKPAIDLANSLLQTYEQKYGKFVFPEVENKLFDLLNNVARVDKIRVQRFREPMEPIVGQVRLMTGQPGVYNGVETHGTILLCPSLSIDMQRFILVKEAAHLIIDRPDERVSSAEDLDRLLVCIAQFGKDATKHYEAEQVALVLAVEVLLPRRVREQLRVRFESGDISVTDIAVAGAIPPAVVREAMAPTWGEMVNSFYEIEKPSAPRVRLVK